MCIKIPIFTDLLNTDIQDHIEAIKEFLITILISTSPITGGAFLFQLTSKDGASASFLTNLENMLQNGELFIYATTLLAPVIYLALKERDEGRIFPSKIAHIIIVIIVTFLSSMTFTLQRTNSYINTEFAFDASVYIYIIALLITYVAIVFNNNLYPNAAKKWKTDEQDYVDAVRKHRK